MSPEVKAAAESIGDRTRTHGKSRTRTYKIWSYMKRRCQKPSAINYSRYGGQGVRVCERWLDFENFLSDMGECPAGKSIDRIDNSGDYEPGNCRWASAKEQARNTRSNRIVTVDGREMTLAEAAELANQDYQVVHRRLKRGWTLEQALAGSRPSPKRPSKVSPSEVEEIRRLVKEGWTHQSLATKYGISKSQIGNIVYGVHHKDVSPSN